MSAPPPPMSDREAAAAEAREQEALFGNDGVVVDEADIERADATDSWPDLHAVLDWSTARVCEWLQVTKQGALAEFVPNFQRAGVMGEELPKLAESRRLLTKTFGIENQLHAWRLQKQIKILLMKKKKRGELKEEAVSKETESRIRKKKKEKQAELQAQIDQLIKIDMGGVKQGERMGQGACGDVYSATWKLGGEVVVKYIGSRKGNLLSEPDKRRFYAEMVMLHQLSSFPFIIHLYGVSLGSPMCMVMEKAMESAEDYIVKRKQCKGNWERIATIARHVAASLEFCHSKGIIHRDVASRNVLVTTQLQGRLADFGLAVQESEWKEALELAKQVQAGKANRAELGPYEHFFIKPYLHWLSPEVVTEPPQFSFASDVFAFGRTLWEFCACSKPFAKLEESLSSDPEKGRDPRFIAERIAKAVLDGDEPGDLPDDCPRQLASLIRACCAYEPENRPTMRAVHDALSDFKDFLIAEQFPETREYMSIFRANEAQQTAQDPNQRTAILEDGGSLKHPEASQLPTSLPADVLLIAAVKSDRPDCLQTVLTAFRADANMQAKAVRAISKLIQLNKTDPNALDALLVELVGTMEAHPSNPVLLRQCMKPLTEISATQAFLLPAEKSRIRAQVVLKTTSFVSRALLCIVRAVQADPDSKVDGFMAIANLISNFHAGTDVNKLVTQPVFDFIIAGLTVPPTNQDADGSYVAYACRALVNLRAHAKLNLDYTFQIITTTLRLHPKNVPLQEEGGAALVALLTIPEVVEVDDILSDVTVEQKTLESIISITAARRLICRRIVITKACRSARLAERTFALILELYGKHSTPAMRDMVELTFMRLNGLKVLANALEASPQDRLLTITACDAVRAFPPTFHELATGLASKLCMCARAFVNIVGAITAISQTIAFLAKLYPEPVSKAAVTAQFVETALEATQTHPFLPGVQASIYQALAVLTHEHEPARKAVCAHAGYEAIVKSLLIHTGNVEVLVWALYLLKQITKDQKGVIRQVLLKDGIIDVVVQLVWEGNQHNAAVLRNSLALFASLGQTADERKQMVELKVIEAVCTIISVEVPNSGENQGILSAAFNFLAQLCDAAKHSEMIQKSVLACNMIVVALTAIKLNIESAEVQASALNLLRVMCINATTLEQAYATKAQLSLDAAVEKLIKVFLKKAGIDQKDVSSFYGSAQASVTYSQAVNYAKSDATYGNSFGLPTTYGAEKKPPPSPHIPFTKQEAKLLVDVISDDQFSQYGRSQYYGGRAGFNTEDEWARRLVGGDECVGLTLRCLRANTKEFGSVTEPVLGKAAVHTAALYLLIRMINPESAIGAGGNAFQDYRARDPNKQPPEWKKNVIQSCAVHGGIEHTLRGMQLFSKSVEVQALGVLFLSEMYATESKSEVTSRGEDLEKKMGAANEAALVLLLQHLPSVELSVTPRDKDETTKHRERRLLITAGIRRAYDFKYKLGSVALNFWWDQKERVPKINVSNNFQGFRVGPGNDVYEAELPGPVAVRFIPPDSHVDFNSFQRLIDNQLSEQMKKKATISVHMARKYNEMAMLHKLSSFPYIMGFNGASVEAPIAMITERAVITAYEHFVVQQASDGDWERIATVALHIADSLRFCHQQGVIHRDVAAKNVYLTKQLQGRLSGFTLAVDIADWHEIMRARLQEHKPQPPDPLDAHLMNIHLCRTPFHALPAPELLVRRAEKSFKPDPNNADEALELEYSPASDVYAFGGFLYEISTREVCKKPLQMPPKIPKHLAEIITDCVKPNPGERPSMRDIFTKLQGFLDFLVESKCPGAKKYYGFLTEEIKEMEEEEEILRAAAAEQAAQSTRKKTAPPPPPPAYQAVPAPSSPSVALNPSAVLLAAPVLSSEPFAQRPTDVGGYATGIFGMGIDIPPPSEVPPPEFVEDDRVPPPSLAHLEVEEAQMEADAYAQAERDSKGTYIGLKAETFTPQEAEKLIDAVNAGVNRPQFLFAVMRVFRSNVILQEKALQAMLLMVKDDKADPPMMEVLLLELPQTLISFKDNLPIVKLCAEILGILKAGQAFLPPREERTSRQMRDQACTFVTDGLQALLTSDRDRKEYLWYRTAANLISVFRNMPEALLQMAKTVDFILEGLKNPANDKVAAFGCLSLAHLADYPLIHGSEAVRIVSSALDMCEDSLFAQQSGTAALIAYMSKSKTEIGHVELLRKRLKKATDLVEDVELVLHTFELLVTMRKQAVLPEVRVAIENTFWACECYNLLAEILERNPRHQKLGQVAAMVVRQFPPFTVDGAEKVALALSASLPAVMRSSRSTVVVCEAIFALAQTYVPHVSTALAKAGCIKHLLGSSKYHFYLPEVQVATLEAAATICQHFEEARNDCTDVADVVFAISVHAKLPKVLQWALRLLRQVAKSSPTGRGAMITKHDIVARLAMAVALSQDVGVMYDALVLFDTLATSEEHRKLLVDKNIIRIVSDLMCMPVFQSSGEVLSAGLEFLCELAQTYPAARPRMNGLAPLVLTMLHQGINVSQAGLDLLVCLCSNSPLNLKQVLDSCAEENVDTLMKQVREQEKKSANQIKVESNYQDDFQGRMVGSDTCTRVALRCMEKSRTEVGVIKEGFLDKQGSGTKGFLYKRRWCVFYQGELMYYKNKGDPEPLGVIKVNGESEVGATGNKSQFEIRPRSGQARAHKQTPQGEQERLYWEASGRIYKFNAQNEAEREDWLFALTFARAKRFDEGKYYQPMTVPVGLPKSLTLMRITASSPTEMEPGSPRIASAPGCPASAQVHLSGLRFLALAMGDKPWDQTDAYQQNAIQTAAVHGAVEQLAKGMQTWPDNVDVQAMSIVILHQLARADQSAKRVWDRLKKETSLHTLAKNASVTLAKAEKILRKLELKHPSTIQVYNSKVDFFERRPSVQMLWTRRTEARPSRIAQIERALTMCVALKTLLPKPPKK